jgi:hypothetical protein
MKKTLSTFSILNLSLIYGTLFLSRNTLWALVDYSDNEKKTPGNKSETPYERVRNGEANQLSTQRAGGSNLNKLINLQLKYDSLDVRSNQKSAEASIVSINGHIQTKNSIFVTFKYWQAQSENVEISQDNSFQEGNPEVKLGFNWLRFGEGEEAANIDLYLGGVFRTSESDFASSRNDKLVGIQTSKMFDRQFMLTFGSEYKIMGSPKNADHLKLGDSKKFYAAMVWAATPDIRFALEGSSTKIDQGEKTDGPNVATLDKDISFAQISPKLLLMLSPFYNLELGANFRTKKATADQDLTKARLFGEEGMYGNSIYAGINITL